MGEDDSKVILNIGCGFRKMKGAVNVDAFPNCEPDVLWNLNKTPWPWADESVDMIHAHQVMEHLDDWWAALKECSRILKVGGTLEISVPDHTSTIDMGYRPQAYFDPVFLPSDSRRDGTRGQRMGAAGAACSAENDAVRQNCQEPIRQMVDAEVVVAVLH
jgi:SAM-dependent methyltransferase